MKIILADFNYNLPENKIAKYPLQERDKSKLLIYKHENISADIFVNLTGHLSHSSCLIFNDTKVIEARILFKNSQNNFIEIFCLEPYENDVAFSLQRNHSVRWNCLIGNLKKWKNDVLTKELSIHQKKVLLTAKKIKRDKVSFLIEFLWDDDDICFAEILQYAGDIPLPPYIKRKPEKNDTHRYQTIYALNKGSVAAPTAGFHFTEAMFKKLKKEKIPAIFTTLHVSSGTFKPVQAENILDHEMHAEWIIISKKTIENILENTHKNIVAVGTTSLRTIETIFWLGVKTNLNADILQDELNLSQWEAYQLENKNTHLNISSVIALQSLIKWMGKNNLEIFSTSTKLMIIPGYKLKIAKALITNFHQPKSTLLLLVAAITKNNWRKIYDYALENNFRFLSFGDSSLIYAD